MTTTLPYLVSASLILFTLIACDSKTEKENSASAAVKSTTENTTKTAAGISKAADVITIINPRIRAMPPGQKVTAMYMQLKNASTNNHDLVKVESDISNMIELHTHTNNDGVMSMGEVESIPLPANTTAEAKPGSYHVMIMGLKEDLTLGEKVDFNLTYKDGSSKSISVEVKQLELH